MTQDAFQLLKDTCTDACHERHACADGYKQMLASENVSQMMATWRANWEDVVESKYADIIRTELPKQYDGIKKEMNAAGIYLNECPEGAKRFVKVIITDTDQPVRIYGDAQAYVLGDAKVIAYDHAQVYNTKMDNANIWLRDYAYGDVCCGFLLAQDRSRVSSSRSAKVTLNGAIDCISVGGNVTAYKYRSIDASGNVVVYAHSHQNIYMSGDAKFENLKLGNNE